MRVKRVLCPRSWPRLQACHCPSLRGNAPLAISIFHKRVLRAHASGHRPSTKWKLLVCSRGLAFEFSLLMLPPAAGLSGPASSALPLALRALLLAFRFMLSVLALSRSRYFSLPRWTLASEGFNCRKRLRIAREALSVTSKHTADEHHLRISLTGSLRARAVQWL